MYKVCKTCKKQLHIINFYSNGYQPNGKKKYKPNCANCEKQKRVEQFLSRIKLIKGFIHCEFCGYNKNWAALDFHHKDPTTKENEVAQMKTHSIEKLKIEIDKCLLLCANCHREVHNPSCILQ